MEWCQTLANTPYHQRICIIYNMQYFTLSQINVIHPHTNHMGWTEVYDLSGHMQHLQLIKLMETPKTTHLSLRNCAHSESVPEKGEGRGVAAINGHHKCQITTY